MKILTETFIKNLGNGRAWFCLNPFTQEFFETLMTPFEDFKDYLFNLKSVHFASRNLLLDDIQNGESLFGINHIADTLSERANNIEMSWRMLAGNSSYSTLEHYLQKAGFDVWVVEISSAEVPDLGRNFCYGGVEYGGTIEGKKAQYGGHNSKVIGNGLLDIEGTQKEPAQIINGKNAFYIVGYFDPSDEDWDYITEIVLKFKPAHTVAICQIAERKVADNGTASTRTFADSIDGGTASTKIFKEKLNK